MMLKFHMESFERQQSDKVVIMVHKQSPSWSSTDNRVWGGLSTWQERSKPGMSCTTQHICFLSFPLFPLLVNLWKVYNYAMEDILINMLKCYGNVSWVNNSTSLSTPVCLWRDIISSPTVWVRVIPLSKSFVFNFFSRITHSTHRRSLNQ